MRRNLLRGTIKARSRCHASESPAAVLLHRSQHGGEEPHEAAGQKQVSKLRGEKDMTEGGDRAHVALKQGAEQPGTMMAWALSLMTPPASSGS